MTGFYESLDNYVRGRVLYQGLKSLDENVSLALPQGRFKVLKLVKKLIHKDFDIIIVNGKRAFFTCWLLKWWHHAKIIHDVFLSDYEVLVLDRKKISPASLKAKFLRFSDRWSCILADKWFFETQANVNFFAKEFNVPKNNSFVIFVGADTSMYYPRSIKHNGFLVHFHGNYIPVQGVDIIVRAAKLLESEKEIHFFLLGSGQTYADVKKLSDSLNNKNITFHPTLVPLAKIPEFIAKGDICLGIFGDIDRGRRAIATKVYDCIAMKKPVINIEGSGIRELFVPGKEIITCNSSPESLAKAILEMYKNPVERKRIASAGYEKLLNRASSQVLAKKLLKEITLK